MTAYAGIGIVLHLAAEEGRSITYKLYGYSRRDSFKEDARMATATDGKPLLKPVWTTGFSYV